MLERSKAGFAGGFLRSKMGKAGIEYWKGLLGDGFSYYVMFVMFGMI